MSSPPRPSTEDEELPLEQRVPALEAPDSMDTELPVVSHPTGSLDALKAAMLSESTADTTSLETTLLSRFFPRRHTMRLGRRAPLLALESFIYTALAIFIPARLGLEESGLISLFLASIPLAERLRVLLDENRDLIWDSPLPKWRANRLTAYSLLSLFMGLVLAYVLAVSIMSGREAVGFFDFAFEAARLGKDTILDRKFGAFPSILASNALVAVSIFLLSLLYRMYGAMLALAWNGCLWASALSVLIGRAALMGGQGGQELRVRALGTAAVLPHLVVEGLAYILVALGAIYISKAMTKYRIGSDQFEQVARAAGLIVLTGAGVLLVGAVLEAVFAPWVLSFI